MLQKTSRFRGGYRFRLFEGTPRQPVLSAEPPPRVVIPLIQGSAAATEIAVEAGTNVRAGDVLAQAGADGDCDIHASIAGTVASLPCREAEEAPWAVEIKRTDAGKGAGAAGAQEKGPDALPGTGALLSLLRASGLGAILPDGFFKSDVSQVSTLVVACLQTAPLLPSAEDLYASQEQMLCKGAELLRTVSGADTICFVVGKSDQQLAQSLSNASGSEVISLQERYPQEHPALLKKVLFAGRDSGSKSVLCVEGRAALAAYQVVYQEMPFTELLVSVGGSALEKPGIYKVPLGTIVNDLVAPLLKPGLEVRYVLGDFLTGTAVSPDTPLTRATRAVTVLPENRERKFLAFMRPGARHDSFSRSFLSSILPLPRKNDTNIHGEYRPCINCSWCENVCPADLMPDLLMKLLRIDELEEAERFRIMDCIDCGLCSYICPSKLPLFQELVEGKKNVQKELYDD